jgi:hypothetical protein
MLNSAAPMQVSSDTSTGIVFAASANPSTSITSSFNRQAGDGLVQGSVRPILVSTAANQATKLVPPGPAAQLSATSQMDASTVKANTTSIASVPFPTAGAGPVVTGPLTDGSTTTGSTTGGSVASGAMSANAVQNNGGDSATVQPLPAPADRSSVAGSNSDHVIAEVVTPQVLNARVATTSDPTLARSPAQTSPPENSAIEVNINARQAESLLASTLSSSPSALSVAADPQMASSLREVTPPGTISSDGSAAWLEGGFSLPVSVNPALISNSKAPQMDRRGNSAEQNPSPPTAVSHSMSSLNISAPGAVSQASIAASKVPEEARQVSNSNLGSGVQTPHLVGTQASAPSASVTALPGTATVVSASVGLKPTPSASPQPTVAREILEPLRVSVPGPVHMAQIINKLGQSEIHIGMNTSAFGSVEVHTVIHASEVGLMIGSEKGDLRSLLANEMPGIAHTMQQQNLRLNTVSFQQGFSASSNSSGGGDSPPHGSHPSFIGAVNPAIAVTNVNDSVEPVLPGFLSTPGRLSILV